MAADSVDAFLQAFHFATPDFCQRHQRVLHADQVTFKSRAAGAGIQ